MKQNGTRFLLWAGRGGPAVGRRSRAKSARFSRQGGPRPGSPRLSAHPRPTDSTQAVPGTAAGQACENRFRADFSPLFSCRSPQAALNLSYRSNSVSRLCPVALRVRAAKSGARIVLDGPVVTEHRVQDLQGPAPNHWFSPIVGACLATLPVAVVRHHPRNRPREDRSDCGAA